MSRHPVGDGSIYAVLSDPVRAVTGTGVRAFADEHGRVTFDPDVMALPPHVVNGDGQWDVPSTLALLWEVVRVQAKQIEALTRIVPHMDAPPNPPSAPTSPAPAPPPPAGPRHAAPPEWSSHTQMFPGGTSWPDATSPTRSPQPGPGAPPPPPSSPPPGSSPGRSR